MKVVARRIDKLGRIVLPMDLRKAVGLEGEAEVVIGVCGNSITVCGTQARCRLCGAAQDLSHPLGICSSCIAKIKAHSS